MPAIFRFGHKILFDCYLMILGFYVIVERCMISLVGLSCCESIFFDFFLCSEK